MAAMDPVAMTAVGQGSWSLVGEHEAFLHELASPVTTDRAIVDQYLDAKGRAVVGDLATALESADWTAAGVKAALQAFVKGRGLKMPEVMMPLRVAVTRKAQTKAIDAIVAALRKEVVLERLRHAAAG
ncbi:MAG: hypothetical protein IPH30_04860 [Betaproteobacteria bacterium]|nr:hypothetical protein [Betaproteobacteria bacterium]